jgi:dephospho-CoA kinase
MNGERSPSSPKKRPGTVIGLTGGVGAGKSTVAGMLADLGCVVVNSDELGRQALRDPAIRDQIVAWWGRSVLDASGEIDRSAIARIVFAAADERRRLEALVHPWIEARRKQVFASAPRDAPALVIDAPLLLEAGLDRECDAVIFVDAPLRQRQERVRRERGWNEGELARRELTQVSLDRKRSGAHHVVVNDGNLDALASKVRETLQEILRSRSR